MVSRIKKEVTDWCLWQGVKMSRFEGGEVSLDSRIADMIVSYVIYAAMPPRLT